MICAIEGVDGCGKGTQAEAVRAHFAPIYNEVEVMHFPVYDSPTGRIIKNILTGKSSFEDVDAAFVDDQAMVLQSLMVTNRLEQFGKLRGHRGGLLILDRYNPSAIAYGQADGLSLDWLLSIHKALPEPTHYFYLDISVEESFRRRPKREDAYEASRERLEKARANYLDLFRRGGGVSTWHTIDGMREPSEITKQIVETIKGEQN